ncbi:hypothetical protein PM082_018253 [Marasmius tenuissimus]|nr:hypothetical protein PM082_018253 [Marasmius tenuissimus]
MTRRSIFDHAVNSTLFNPSFLAATNVINHNYAYPGTSGSYQGQSTSLCESSGGKLGPRLKTIDVGDIILTREVSSRVIDVMTKPCEKGRVLKSTNPFRARVIRQRQARFAKVRRTVHVAEILQFGDRPFTVVQFEAEDPSNREQLELAIRRHVFEISSSGRTMHFPQLFAVGSIPEIPTLIYHDGLVSADGIMECHTQSPIVTYLHYIHMATYDSFDIRFLSKISVRLSADWVDWLFNLRTGTFQFDLTSNHQPSYADSHRPLRPEAVALPHNALMSQPFVPETIIQHLQSSLSDYLISVSSFGDMMHIENLSELIMAHPYLVLGSVIDISKPGIIGHFLPSDVNPGPTWICVPDDDISLNSYQFYQSGLHRVDLSYSEEMQPFQIHVIFKNSVANSNAARLSYLSQSSKLLGPGSHWDNVAFVEEIGFALYGTFGFNPLAYPTPVYLFVPPVPLNHENGVFGLALPLPYRLFYWSLDPKGRTYVPERDWERYRIPRLKTELWLGSFWRPWHYEAVSEFFRRGNHNPQTYARDRGYPELQKWQDNRFSVVEEVVEPTRYPTWKGMRSWYEEPLIWKSHPPQYPRRRRWSNAM